MMMSSSPLLTIQEKPIMLTGAVGDLEAVLSEPLAPEIPYIGIVCHPHSLQGGSMNNKVVHTVVKAYRDLGMNVIRFNFRGVGKSAGSYDAGIGETDDTISVLTWAKQQWPNHTICLAGFSFGSYVSLRAASKAAVGLLVSIAPAVTYVDYNSLIPHAPWIVIHGDDDELIPVQAVVDWVATLTPAPEFIRISEASHFFHGKLIELRTLLTAAIQKVLNL